MSGQSRPGPGLIDKGYFTDECPPSGGGVDRLLRTAGSQYQDHSIGEAVEYPHAPGVDLGQEVGEH